MAAGKNSCVLGIKKEFHCSNFGLGHDTPRLFITAQCGPNWIYLIWATFWSLYHVVWIALDWYWQVTLTSRPDEPWRWFTFLTNWSYTIQVVFVLCDFLSVIYIWCNRTDVMKGISDGTTWYMKTVWILFNINNTAALLVTILYYFLLGGNVEPRSINKHALNSVYTILNLIFAAKPVRVLHFFQPLIYVVVYTVFSVIYHQLDVGLIYDVLDWDNAGQTLALVLPATLLGIPVVHLIIFAIYRLRLLVAMQICRKKVGVFHITDTS